MSDSEKKIPVTMGGNVLAVTPRSVEEIWRVAKMVVEGGLAPYALVGKISDDEGGNKAVSAVSIAIMFGAELGLPPMAALRSITVINGRPALYGDGLVSVIRRSGKVEYIRMGYDEEKQCGYCEAKRRDTGEELRVTFSIEDAKRAALWDSSPSWKRHPKRMMQWRSAGFCLRDLFADILAGVITEDEAHEIAASDPPIEYEDITPAGPPSAPSGPPAAPPPAPQMETSDADDEPGEASETPEELFFRARQWAKNVRDVEDLETFLDEYGQYLDGLGDDDRKHLQSIMDSVREKIDGPNVMASG